MPVPKSIKNTRDKVGQRGKGGKGFTIVKAKTLNYHRFMPGKDRNLDHGGPLRAARDWEKITLFVFGTFFFIVLLAIALLDKNPSKSSWYIYLWILALAAGGVAALLPGAINVNLHPGIRAGGALAVAVLVFFFGRDRSTGNPIVQGLMSHLDSKQGSVIDPSSSVYVTINSKLAAFDQGGSGPKELDFGQNDWRGAKPTVVRGAGGISIKYGDLKQGDQINVFAKDPSGTWWISNDMIVPEGELEMRSTNPADVKSRAQRGH